MNKTRPSPFLCRLQAHLVGLLLASWPLHSSATPAWTKVAEIPSHGGNLYFHTQWQPEQGTQLRLAAEDGSTETVITVQRDGIRLTASPANPIEAHLLTRPEALPDQPMGKAEWTLKARPRAWTLYLEDNPILVFRPPFDPPAALFHSEVAWTNGTPPRPRFQRSPDFVFEDNFFHPGDIDDPFIEWDTLSGTWDLRTAADATTERGERMQRRRNRKPDPERSANFSNLRGQGDPGIMLTGHDFYDIYTLEASVITAPGEAGLVFYHTDAGASYALTLAMQDDSHQALLRLWRTAANTDAPRDTLAAVVTELTLDQWVKLRVKIYDNRIVGYLDTTLVADVTLDDLPAGGRFGLFADSPTGMLFDDVRARSNHDLSLAALADIRRQTLTATGDFSPPLGRHRRSEPDPDSPPVLRVGRSRQSQKLVLGDPSHEGHVFSAEFDFEDASGQAGLIIGYRDEHHPGWHFTCAVADGEELFRLVKHESGTEVTLEELSLPVREDRQGEPVTLMADATDGHTLRLYRHETLVLAHVLPSATEIGGASGIIVAPGTAARMARPRYTFKRHNRTRDQFEKNRLFREDPFMRNWASPEGEWAQDPQERTWAKGDIYGRFMLRMPYVDGSAIHIAVAEGATNGAWIVRAEAGTLMLEEYDHYQDRRNVRTQASADGLAVDIDPKTKRDTPMFTLHYEGHWIWVVSGDQLLFKQPLATPLSGRRMRISGFSENDLRHSHLERDHVKDYLFNESLHEWTQNGGEWSVVNRFQCDPRWSHMNGEAPDGLAALWSKFDFQGDFCLEMYAGMRHQYYTRAGDLNITAMTPNQTTGQGYSITCTGWDPDHSQRYTRLYRNGVMVKETDAYLVPRHREGQRRRIVDPLIRHGRDLHGAWYHIKLRRAGSRLEYSFDNEKIFAWDDDDPIQEGSFGIWTFMNSMMVARVKMASEHIVPRQHALTAVPLDTTLNGLKEPSPTLLDRHRTLTANGLPSERMLPEYWLADDTTGHTRLRWHDPASSRPYLVATTTLGAGEMLVRSQQPPVPTSELAGWTFEIKRTAGARFNFHYSLGHMNDKGQYTPEAHFFHHISGTDFTKGRFRMIGQTETPSVAALVPNGSDTEPWTRITAWLPGPDQRETAARRIPYARVEGFGNLQPSTIMQGLHGNAPGEAYAVRRFAEIRIRPPELDGTLPSDAHGTMHPAAASTLPEDTVTRLVDLQSRINSITNTGRVAFTLTPAGFPEPLHEWHWINPPETPALSTTWHPDRPGAIRLHLDADYPDSRFHAATLRIGGFDAESWREGDGVRAAFIPRHSTLRPSASPVLTVNIRIGDTAITPTLAWSDAPAREPPVLLSVGDNIPLFENFESRTLPPYMRGETRRLRIENLEPGHNSFLRIANPGQQQRLRSIFPHAVNLAQAPVLLFRYRAAPMSRVSLTLRGDSTIRLSENVDQARDVRHGRPLVRDNTWRTWSGIISDAMGEHTLSRSALNIQSLAFGSRHAIDQTGLFSEIDLDSIVQGPAVSEQRPLRIAPHYFDFHDDPEVMMTLTTNAHAAVATNETLAALVWHSIPNMAETVVATAGLEPGLHYLLLRATNRAGMTSDLTRIPFLYSPRAPTIASSIVASDDPLHNESVLKIDVTTGAGAPLNLEGLDLKWNNTSVEAATLGSRYTHGPDKASIILNWPYIFREAIQQAQDGDHFSLVLTGISDGAGNTGKEIIVPMTLDFSQDKTPPTLLPTDYPDNIFWASGWESTARQDRHFRSRETLSLEANGSDEPYLKHSSRGRASAFWLSFDNSNPWRPAQHPYLAFRMRRPAIDDKTSIVLSLQGHGRQTITIPLAGDSKSDGTVLALPEPIEWEADIWQPITLDLRTMLAKTLSEKELRDLRVRRLHLAIGTTPKPEQTHIKNVFVFAAWQPGHGVNVNAFDASGIAEVVWSTGGTSSSMTFSPVGGDHDFNRWVQAHVLDRAGNATFAWHIPLGPTFAVPASDEE